MNFLPLSSSSCGHDVLPKFDAKSLDLVHLDDHRDGWDNSNCSYREI